MPRSVHRLTWLVFVILVVAVNGGCLAIGAGVAGGAVAGYYLYQGKLGRRYEASFPDTWAATRAVLTESGLTVVSEEQEGAGALLEAQTRGGERARVFVEPGAPEPGGPAQLTQVSVRVGTFGDSPLSEQLLDQIGRRLQSMNRGRAVETAAPPLATAPQSAPPPLASPPPVPKP